ncbi:MAG TPA: methyltransferase domain-containing protein [Polyangiaceae bacterium]|nr:methyltransferase domain-containing protein [Polyangiaceae bacterium]
MVIRAEHEHGGDVDYELHGAGYASLRRADPRIAALVHAALGPARTVLNVGAGAGSYEPSDRFVLAVEPAAAMRVQRPAHLPPAIRAFAESLPFDDASFDASMATITLHQWSDVELGLRELRRVTRGPVVVMTFDPDALDRFWLAEYAPELIAAERGRFPALALIARVLAGSVEVRPVPIPSDCSDGFTEAYYARPECFLDPAVRRGQSAWTFLADGVEAAIVERLRSDLQSGAWDARFGALRNAPELVGSLRIVVSSPSADSSHTQP